MPRRGPPPKGHAARSRAPLGKKSALHRQAAIAEPGVMPTLGQLRDFLQGAGSRVGKSEIASYFGLNTDQRPELRALLRELTTAGHAAPVGRRGLIAHDRLPDMAVVEMTGTDEDGDPIARPVQWERGAGAPPVIFMQAERAGQPALAPGERVLAKLKFIGGNRYEGRTFKRLAGPAPTRILGVFEEGRIIPTDRRQKADWRVPANETNGARPGDIVLAEPMVGDHLSLIHI